MRLRRHSPALSHLARRARDLMSIASLMTLVASCTWLFIGGLLLAHGRAEGASLARVDRLLTHFGWLPAASAGGWRLAAAWAVATAASLAPPLALRGLGRRLWRGKGPNLEVARGFRLPGHALAASLLASLLLPLLGEGIWAAPDMHRLSLGTGSLGLIVATLLAHVVAELVQAGAHAEAENREFI